MDYKEMRKALKDKGCKVPIKNLDVEKAYTREFIVNPEPEPTQVQPLSIVKNDNVYTYVGVGDTPPTTISFMGLQDFFRGDPTVVTNPVVLKKIKDHPCFIKGEVDKTELVKSDKEAEKKRIERQKEDQRIQTEIERANRAKT